MRCDAIQSKIIYGIKFAFYGPSSVSPVTLKPKENERENEEKRERIKKTIQKMTDE